VISARVSFCSPVVLHLLYIPTLVFLLTLSGCASRNPIADRRQTPPAQPSETPPGTSEAAKRSTDVTWDDLKANNVIIMGKPEADPTVSRWLAKGKFIEVGGRIRNLHPAAGEQSEWVDNVDPSDSSQGWTEKYALITMLAGPGQGNWVMSMAGSGSEHPWAMADYLTIPEHATELVRHLRLPSGKLPASYQVVIRVDFKSQIPVKVSYVAHRSLDTP